MNGNSQLIIKYLTLAILAYLFFLITKSYLTIFILAIFFSIIFYPVKQNLQKSLHINQGLSSFVTLFLMVILVLIPFLILVGAITAEAFSFVSTIQTNQAIETLKNLKQIEFGGYVIDISSIQSQAQSVLQSMTGNIYSIATSIGGGVTKFAFSFFVFLLMFYYFLKDGEVLFKKIKKLLPFEAEQNNQLVNIFADVSKTVFTGSIIPAIVSVLFAYLIFFIFGIKGALIWGILAGIFSLIPSIGTFFIYLFGFSYVMFFQGVTPGILFALAYLLIDLIFIQNILKPKLLDEKFAVHPILVFVSLVGGVETFGTPGLLYGPLVVIMFISVFNFWVSKES